MGISPQRILNPVGGRRVLSLAVGYERKIIVSGRMRGRAAHLLPSGPWRPHQQRFVAAVPRHRYKGSVAYARRYRASDGTDHWYLSWRERGKIRTQRLPAGTHETTARATARAMSAAHGTARRPEAIAPLAALGRFLEHVEKVKRRSPDTVRFYREALTPLFRHMAETGPMRAWSLRSFEAFVALHPKWSARTIQARAVAARTFAKWARVHGYMVGDFARDFQGPRVSPPRKEAYDAEELRRILAASIGHTLEIPVHLAFWVGHSHGDIARLTWEAIDLKAGWIEERRSKTKRDQPLPISPDLKAVLSRHKKRSGLVCPDFDRGAATWPWRQLCRRARVDPTGGLKKLRHTYATMLDATREVDNATHAALMAHAPGSAMPRRYSHPDRERLRDGIAALGKALNSM